MINVGLQFIVTMFFPSKPQGVTDFTKKNESNQNPNGRDKSTYILPLCYNISKSMSPGSMWICLKARLMPTLKILAAWPNLFKIWIMESSAG